MGAACGAGCFLSLDIHIQRTSKQPYPFPHPPALRNRIYNPTTLARNGRHPIPFGPKQNKGRECMVWFSASSPEYTSILHPYLILLLSASPRALRPTALPGLLPDFGPNKDPNSFESSRTVTLHLKDNNTFYRISFHQHYISHHHNIMTQLKVSHNGHNPC